MPKIFIDTNILIYSMDHNDREKMEKSRELLKGLTKSGNGVISTQVLQEFYVTATKKLNSDSMIVKEIMRSFENFEIVSVSLPIIKQAIDCSVLNTISFWDALIISAAESARCTQVWTEDLNNGQVIQGVKVINPFL